MYASKGARNSRPQSKKLSLFLTGLTLGTLLLTAACGDSPAPTPGLLQEPTLGQSSQAMPTRTGHIITDSLVGALDPTFGAEGLVTTDLGGNIDTIHSIVVQPDGKILVAGEAWPDRSQQIALARYNEDGSLDDTFGNGGIVTTKMIEENFYHSMAHALLLQPDGKILVVGESASTEVGHPVFALARYHEDGSLDDTFGDGGKVLHILYEPSYSIAGDKAMAAALQPDGKIVAAGITGNYPPDFGVARYNPDGSVDETFGDGGKVVTDFRNDDDGAYAVSVQPDGKIVVAGYASAEANVERYDYAMARYNEDGSLDKTFGDGGKVITNSQYGYQDEAHAMVLQPDGKITLAGISVVGAQFCQTSACWKYGFGMMQYNPDGTLDKTFGNNGEVVHDYLYSAGNYALVRLPNGQLATAGYVSHSDFNIALYNADGSPDESFGEKGSFRIKFGEYGDDAYALAVQADGKLVVGGTASVDPEDLLNGDFALVRIK